MESVPICQINPRVFEPPDNPEPFSFCQSNTVILLQFLEIPIFQSNQFSFPWVVQKLGIPTKIISIIDTMIASISYCLRKAGTNLLPKQPMFYQCICFKLGSQSTLRLKNFKKQRFISTVRPTVHTNPSRKRSFISTVRPTVHTNPSRKRSFIATVRLTVHTNPSRKRSFSKTLLPPEEFKGNLHSDKKFTSNHTK